LIIVDLARPAGASPCRTRRPCEKARDLRKLFHAKQPQIVGRGAAATEWTVTAHVLEAAWRPDFVVGGDGALDCERLHEKEFAFIHSGLQFACYFEVKPGADRLIVAPASWVNRRETPPPVYGGRDWGRRLDGHLLCVSDPTLFLSDRLVSGMFLGRPDADPIEGLIEIAGRVATSLGLAAERIIYFGASGSGTAAIRAAAASQKGRAVVVNAFMQITSYARRHSARDLAGLYGPRMTLFEMSRLFPSRMSPIEALRSARESGRRPRAAVLQNTADGDIYHNHFPLLCQAFGIDIGGGVDSSGQIRALPLTWVGGHGEIAPEILARIAGEEIPWLLRA
jgi:hypothetical protein